MTRSAVIRTAAVACSLAAWLLSSLPAAAQVPAAPTLQASASGSTVSASWNAVGGATAYRVEAGITPALMLAGYDIGPLTSFTLPNVPQGTYYLRVRARNASGLGAPSNVVGVTVTSVQGPPAAPTNLAASVSGSTVTLTVDLPPGPLTGLVLVGGTTPGSGQAAVPLSVSPTNTLPNVPPGVYYVRVVALNAGGPSPASNEVQIVVSASCTAPPAPTLTAQVQGQAVLLSWNAIAGAAGYRLDAALSPGGAPVLSQPLPASTTAVSNPSVAPGTYYVKVAVGNACGQTATSPEVAVVVNATPGGGNRTPNPPAGQRLPLPNRSSIVNEMARLYPADLRNSCVSQGGNNTWLYRVVQRLRQEDTRWGLNWKRGNVGDMSQDVIDYNWGSEADEGTRQVYVVDIIGGHCGGSPGPAWQDVTGPAAAIWTLQPYLAAGFPPY
ncbi:MAG: hypothetical protein R2745_04550 [Vicinamibacterales bacterium]